MASPRTARISASGRSSRLRPSRRISPPAILPGGLGTSRMMESEVTDLPQPDSPTMPSVSPGASEKLTPSTAANTLPPERNSVRRSRTSRRGVMRRCWERATPVAHLCLQQKKIAALQWRAPSKSRHRPRLRQAILGAIDRRRQLVGGAAGPVALAHGREALALAVDQAGGRRLDIDRERLAVLHHLRAVDIDVADGALAGRIDQASQPLPRPRA